MSDPTAPSPHDSRRRLTPPDDDLEPPETGDAAAESTGSVDLSSLSIAGISRRHVGWVAAGLISLWIVVIFARQVSEASAAATRATQLAADNAALASAQAAAR